MVKSCGWWGGGPCDFSVSTKSFLVGLKGLVGQGNLDLGLTILAYQYKERNQRK